MTPKPQPALAPKPRPQPPYDHLSANELAALETLLIRRRDEVTNADPMQREHIEAVLSDLRNKTK